MVQTVTSRVPDTALWSGNGGDATVNAMADPLLRAASAALRQFLGLDE